MMKQILLKSGIVTDFYSKAVNVQFIKMVKSNVTFKFIICKEEVTMAEKQLEQYGKYERWHSVEGVDSTGNICVKGRVQVYLRLR